MRDRSSVARAIRLRPVRIPNAELAYIAPAVAREYRRNPSSVGDACLERMLAAVARRSMVDVGELCAEILRQTGAAPTRSAAHPSDAREV